MLTVWINMCCGEFLLWLSLVGVLYAPYSLIGNLFFRLGKYNLVESIFCALPWVSFPSISIPDRFGLFIVFIVFVFIDFLDALCLDYF